MANNPLAYDVAVEASLNAFAALMNSGFLAIYTGSQPSLDGALTGTLLVSLSFGPTAYGSATAAAGNGSAAANGIPSATAVGTGTAGYFAMLKSDNTTVVGTGTVGLSGADLNMSTLTIISGTLVTCSAFTLTQNQTG